MNKRIIFTFLLFVQFSAIGQEKYTLERFIAEVLEKDFGILILKNEVEIAQNNNNPGAAGYLPTIQATADQNWSSNNTRQEFFSGTVNEADAAKNTSLNAAVRLNWTFFDGFRMFATDKRLDLLQETSTMQLTAEMEMKMYQASVLFYTVLQQERMLEIYRQALELSKARFDLLELKRKNGAASEIQLIQARLDLTSDSSVVLNAQKLIAQAKADMNRFLTKDPATQFSVEGEFPMEMKLDWETKWNEAKAQNSAILLAKSALAIRDMERKEVQSFFYPQVSFYSQFAFARSENEVGILNSNRSLGPGVGFTVQWTILDRLATFTALKNNTIQRENADLQVKNQELQLQTELKKAFTEYEWAVKNMQLELQNKQESELNFDIAQQAFEAGSITNLELREVQFSIVQAQNRFLQAQLVLKTAELNLALLTGDFKKII